MHATASQLATLLLEHVTQDGVVDLDQLATDPEKALLCDRSVSVRWVDRSSLPEGCAIAATYVGDRSPAEITVANDESPGRRRFSLIHEYGHHLRDQVTDVLTALFSFADPGWLEERMCDAFASFVLIPTEVRASAFVDGVTARAVIELMGRVSASEQAVAVAAAEAMSEPGYVMLLNHAGEAEFAARSGNVYPIFRRTPQTGLALRAASGEPVRGIDRLNRGTNLTAEMHLDGATGSGRTVLVAFDGRAPWTLFGGGRAQSAVFDQHHCEQCGYTFTALGAPCPHCGEPKCTECHRCACHERPLGGSRACDRCWTVQPPAAFHSPDASTCLDCH